MKEYKVIIDGNVEKEEGYYSNGQKKYESYYINDKHHREDGPAVQRWYENGKKEYEEYWLNDKKISKEEFVLYTRKRKFKKLFG